MRWTGTRTRSRSVKPCSLDVPLLGGKLVAILKVFCYFICAGDHQLRANAMRSVECFVIFILIFALRR